MADTTNVTKVTNDAYFEAIFKDYQDRIPKATVDNFKQIGDLIMERPNMKNEFINTLFNKIGLTLLQNKYYTSTIRQGKHIFKGKELSN